MSASAADEPGTSSEGATSLSTALRAAANLQSQQKQAAGSRQSGHYNTWALPTSPSSLCLQLQLTYCVNRHTASQLCGVCSQPTNSQPAAGTPSLHRPSPACAGLHTCMQQQIVLVRRRVHPLAQRCSCVCHVSSQAGNIQGGLQATVGGWMVKEHSKSAALYQKQKPCSMSTEPARLPPVQS